MFHFIHSTMNIHIRPYKTSDKSALIELLGLNTPKYFAAEEAADFKFFLTNEIEYYFVAELDARIVACGGINFSGDETHAKISWDMVHPDVQGKSIGKQLLQHRLQIIQAMPQVKKITVRTSQLAYRFYEKAGFQLRDTAKDYWAEGFDLYAMEYADA